MSAHGGLRRRSPLALIAVLAALLAALLLASPPGGAAPRAKARGATYLNAAAPVGARVADLLSRMTLAEKIGQMGQINAFVLMGNPDDPWDRAPFNQDQFKLVLEDNHIGSILSGGGAWPPAGNDAEAWADMVNQIQAYALEHSRLRIPIIYGVDAVHGHNNLSDATQAPHQVNLGATFDPAVVLNLARRTAKDVRATGISWDFAPVLDTQRDERWGRSYEPFGEDPLLTGTLGAAAIRGLQGAGLNRPDTVAATAKHFIGYSAPDTGRDRTDATIPEAELRDIHLPPFAMGIDAGAATAMLNSGSVNGVPGHANGDLVTGVLRGELGFDGPVVSDWQDVENLVTKYHVADTMEDALALAVNAGMDMSMIPLDAPGFTQGLTAAVEHGKVTAARIDEAVGRILALKVRLGLFERPFVDASRANRVVEDPAHRPLARKAARESLVLLENDGTLPLAKDTGTILVTGPAADDPANQVGGWSVGWQGAFGLPADVTVPPATTVLEGITAAVGAGHVTFSPGVPVGDTTNRSGTPDVPVPPDPVNDPAAPGTAAAIQAAVDAAADADAIVVAVGESPYAETQGDDDTPALPPSQATLIDRLTATGKPVVVVVVAGRPLVMNEQLDAANATLMAFWPGSEGGSAIADVLFGDHGPSGRLPVSWPRSVDQFPLAYNEPGAGYDPRFAFGYGLSYTTWATDQLRASPSVRPGQRVQAGVTVRNTGDRTAETPVLAFAEGTGGDAAGAPRRLVAFTRVKVARHGRRRVTLAFPASGLAFFHDGARSVAAGTYELTVGDATATIRVR